MKSVLYIGYPPDTRAAPHQHMAAIALARDGWNVRYVHRGTAATCLNHAPPSSYTFASPPKVLLKSKLLSALWLFYRVSRDLLSYSFGLVYVQGAQNCYVFKAIKLLRGKTPLVYHTQDYLEPRRHPHYEYLERSTAKHADLVILNDVSRARVFASYYQLKSLPFCLPTYLPGWWETPKRTAELRANIFEKYELGDPETSRLIIAGGPPSSLRLSSRLIDAIAKLPSSYKLVFTGDGRNFDKFVGHLGQSERNELLLRIVFVGSLTYDEFLKLLCAGDVGVLFYANDGIGNFFQSPGRLTEYLRCGLRVLTSELPRFQLLALQTPALRTCNPDDAAATASAILQLTAESNTTDIERAAFRLRYEVAWESLKGEIDDVHVAANQRIPAGRKGSST